MYETILYRPCSMQHTALSHSSSYHSCASLHRCRCCRTTPQQHVPMVLRQLHDLISSREYVSQHNIHLLLVLESKLLLLYTLTTHGPTTAAATAATTTPRATATHTNSR